MEETQYDLDEERTAVSNLGREMLEQDLTKGTGGNISVGNGEYIAINPSGVPYEDITPDTVPVVTYEGKQVSDGLDASSETPMHTIIHRARDDIGAVVHTHAPYASTFATLAEPIPASHYLIAFSGQKVPVAEYRTPGSEELGQLAADTMDEEYNACLLQNHGTISVGETAEEAFEVALMVEYCARIQYQAQSIGEPTILSEDIVDNLIDIFEGYGQRTE